VEGLEQMSEAAKPPEKRIKLPADAPNRPLPIWRYMSFARFVWTLQNRALWFSRADLLGDTWEFYPTRQQVPKFIKLWEEDVATGRPTPYKTVDEARAGLKIAVWRTRRTTFVNCWTFRSTESYSMWRDYCLSREGVAIRATMGRLYDSLDAPIEVLKVRYEPEPEDMGSLDLWLGTQKRPPFESEKEVRAILPLPLADPDKTPPGLSIVWDVAKLVDKIRVHPDATPEFLDTVRRTAKAFAPALTDLVEQSEMLGDPEAAFHL
jgi:hypothetical protein